MNRLVPALLGGPDTPPAVQRGDRATCLYRDGDVVITSWTAAPVPWLRCQRPGQRGGSGLLVNEELVRAVRTESARALQYWFGVSAGTAWRWRIAFGVYQWGTKGSRPLLQASSAAGAETIRGKPQAEETIRKGVQTRRAKGIKPDRWAKDGWKPEQLALVSTMPDAEVARPVRSDTGNRRRTACIPSPTASATSDQGTAFRRVAAGSPNRGTLAKWTVEEYFARTCLGAEPTDVT